MAVYSINIWIDLPNEDVSLTCRLCQQINETMERIISACPILAKEQYMKRHDRVCAQLHFNIRKETGVKADNEH
jgi:hypothetical protein